MTHAIESKLSGHILFLSEIPGSHYFNAVDCDDDKIKIRVSDHNANAANIKYSERVISFITRNDRKPSNPKTNSEYIINAEGNIVDWTGEETGETIESILSDYCIKSFKL